MVPDLRLCTIRLSNDHDRRFVFEIISPQKYESFIDLINHGLVNLVVIFFKLIVK